MQKPDIESKINSKKNSMVYNRIFSTHIWTEQKKLENNSAQTLTKTQFKLMK